MKHIVVIDENLPFPADYGKSIRTTELLTRLLGEFRITLAYHDMGATKAEGIEQAQDAGFTLLPVKKPPLHKQGLPFAWDLLRNIPLADPYMVMAHSSHDMRQAMAKLLASNDPPHLLHVEWTPLYANVVGLADWPVTIAAHNIEAQIWHRYLQNERSLLKRWYISLQYRKVRRFEAMALKNATGVIAVSDQDGTHIRQSLQQRHVTVVPNGVNSRYFAPQPEMQVDPEQIVFVGSLDWRPNQDGVRWFLEAVLPKVRKERPDVHLALVGRNPPDWLHRLARTTPGVELHASVPDVRPFVAASAAMVVPLRIGSGTRLKICEALAMERPVVSTTVGAEGLDLGDGIICADQPADMARCICQLLAAPREAVAMARRGRQRVLAHYDWDVCAPLQAVAWHNAIERQKS